MAKSAFRHPSKVRYIRIPEFLVIRDQTLAEGKGINKIITKFSNYNPSILEDCLMNPLSDEDVWIIFELPKKRYDCHSIIFFTQYKTPDYHTRLGNGTLC